MPALRLAQERTAAGSRRDAIREVADALELTPAYCLSIASFYDQFRLEPVGRHVIEVCTNVSCALAGAQQVVEAFERELGVAAGRHDEDGEYTLGTIECLGGCGWATVVAIDNRHRLRVQADDVPGIVEELRGALSDAARSSSPAPTAAPSLEIDGLRGRQAASRRCARRARWRRTTSSPSSTPRACAAAAARSSRPAASGRSSRSRSKLAEAALPRRQRRRVGARHVQGPRDHAPRPVPLPRGLPDRGTRRSSRTHVFIYIRGEYEREFEILRDSLEAMRKGRPPRRRHVVLHRGAGAYICGEETALLESLEGKRGQPRTKPPFPAIAGLYAAPTAVNNVESITTATSVLEMGGAEYAKLGVENSTGTRVFSLSGDVVNPRQLRAAARHLDARADLRRRRRGAERPRAQGRDPRRLVDRGPDRATTIDVKMDFDSLVEAGSSIGSAAVIVIDDRCCMVQLGIRVSQFYEHESCGKCTPCRVGTKWVTQILQKIEDGARRRPTSTCCSRSATGSWASACARSATRTRSRCSSYVDKFRDEFQAHIDLGRCPFDGDVVARGDPRTRRATARAHTGTRRRMSELVSVTVDDREVDGAEGHRPRRGGRRRRESRSRCSATSRGSARPSARAACASSRSRGCRSSRPAARSPRRTAWSIKTSATSRRRPRGRRRRSSSSSSTTRSTARSATRAASARCRTSRSATGPATRGCRSRSSRSTSRSPSRR